MQQKSCAFTGHRPARFIFGYDEKDERCKLLKRALEGEIRRLAAGGVSRFYTGMALGVDMWAAEIVLKHKRRRRVIQLVAVLPCPGQGARWPAAQQKRHAAILEKADEIVIISHKYTPSCMHERNRYMADHATCLLAVYDGGETGGTAYTVEYARARGLEIVRVWPF